MYLLYELFLRVLDFAGFAFCGFHFLRASITGNKLILRDLDFVIFADFTFADLLFCRLQLFKNNFLRALLHV